MCIRFGVLLVSPNDCPRDLWRVLSSTVKAPVFREEVSRAANAGKISALHLVRITQRLILFSRLPAVPSLGPAASSTTTATNERIKLGLTETGTVSPSLLVALD